LNENNLIILKDKREEEEKNEIKLKSSV